MKRLLLLLLMLGLATSCFAARIFTEVSGSYDSDHASSVEAVVGYRQLLTEGGVQVEAASGYRTYAVPGIRENFSVGRLQLQNSKDRTWQMTLRSDFLSGAHWSPILPAALLSGRPHDAWYVEVSAGREIVDSVSAINRHLLLDSYVSSVDFQIDNSWTVVGAALYQRFSDDNEKKGGVWRLIFTPKQMPGLHLQLKGRLLQTRQSSLDYFSPKTLRDGFMLLGYARPIADDNFIFKLLGGPGLQQIEPFAEATETKTAYLGEVSLRGWIEDRWQLISRVGCTSANETNDAYHYCYAKMQLGYEW